MMVVTMVGCILCNVLVLRGIFVFTSCCSPIGALFARLDLFLPP